jgi:hypothetical protein
MPIQKIIQESLNKNPLSLKEALEEELRSRVALALEAKISETKNDDEEEYDQIDEISKKTLSSYIKKASDNAANHAATYGRKSAEADEIDRMTNRHMKYSDKEKLHQIMKTTQSDVDAPRYKAAKRLKGIDRAVNKLARD